MKTKTVELWCDLWPGWQDSEPRMIHVSSAPYPDKVMHNKRIKIIVELLCFGGSVEQDSSVTARSEEVHDQGSTESRPTGKQ